MEKAKAPQVDLDNVGPEIKSYIYQSLAELEPYTTPTTLVAVVAKNPLRLLKSKDNVEASDVEKMKTMYRISISLSEDGTKVEGEGLSEDIYIAIKKAKDSVLKKLELMYDEVVSQKDRQMQIRSVMNGNQGVH